MTYPMTARQKRLEVVSINELEALWQKIVKKRNWLTLLVGSNVLTRPNTIHTNYFKSKKKVIDALADLMDDIEDMVNAKS